MTIGEAKPSKRTEHYAHLDSLRALAALFVVLHHSWLTIWPIMYGRLPHGAIRYLTGYLLYGHFAVDLFIVLSGFCLMLPVVARDMQITDGAKGFFLRRARRILPPYYFAVLFSLIIAVLFANKHTGTHWDNSVPVTAEGIVNHLLLIQDFQSDPNINHALWSIAVECHIYLFFPLMIWAWRKFDGVLTTVVTSIISFFLYMIAKKTGHEITNPQYLALFAFGALGAAVATSREPRWVKVKEATSWRMVAIIFAAAVCVSCSMVTWRVSFGWFGLLDVCVGISSMALLILTTARPGSLRRQLNRRPLVWCGAFAYSIYLIHAPLVQIVWQYAIHPLRLTGVPAFLLLVLLDIPFVIAVSYAFFLVCERPYLSRRLKIRDEAPAGD